MAPQAIARGDGDPLLGLEVAGRFGLVGLSATGARTAVYDAWDAANAAPCVLKIARCERHALSAVHDLFLREAGLMRAAPPAMKVRAAGAHEAEPSFAFLAMDRAQGEPITLARAALEDRATAAIAAVSALHGAGVFHGDLKPSHVVFDQGRVALLDFGSAALANEPGEAARATTPAYAAPEREAGPSAASDVYSLGCMLFELGAGERPFAGLSGAALAEAHASKPVSCDRVPSALARAVGAALAKRAADRPSAAELQALVT